MAFIAEMGVIATEVKKPREIKGGTSVVTDFPVYFNDYVPGVGNTTFEAIVSLWDEKANWIYAEAQKHKRKDGTETKGKGMPMFFIGHAYTDKYNGRSGEVKQTKINGVDVLFSATPVFQATGVIGTEIKEPRDVDTRIGKTKVLDIPVFFNGYVPGIKKTALETYVTLWGDRANWLYEKAQNHTKKDGPATKGRGMAMDFICYVYTDKYIKDGVEVKQAKIVAADVKYPQSVFGPSTRGENTPTNNTADAPNNTYTAPPANEPNNEPYNQEMMQEPNFPDQDPFAGLGMDEEGDQNGILTEFDDFLKDIAKQGAN